MRSPTRKRIAVHGVKQSLRDRLEEVLGLEIGLPQAFAGAKELV